MNEPKELTPEEQRLAEIRARRAEIAAKRAAREAAQATEVQLAEEQLALRNDEAIEKAEAEHGALGKKIEAVRTIMGVVIVKRAHHLLFRKYQEKGERSTSEDTEKLIRPCVVYPDTPELDRILTEQPAELINIANAVCRLAGVRVQEVSGK